MNSIFISSTANAAYSPFCICIRLIKKLDIKETSCDAKILQLLPGS